MQTYTSEELEEQFQALPQVLKEAMYSPDVAEKMVEIGKKFGLANEKTGLAAEETGYVIIGLTKPREFVQALSDALTVDVDNAKKIASEINHQIFYPLREALKSAHQVDITEEEIQKAEVLVRKPVMTPPPTAPKPSASISAPVSPPKAPEPQFPTVSPKVPPIDLRPQKQSLISPPVAAMTPPYSVTPPSPATAPKTPEAPKPTTYAATTSTGAPSPSATMGAAKKAPYGGFDPYRETSETKEKITSKVPLLDLRGQMKPAETNPESGVLDDDAFSALKRSTLPAVDTQSKTAGAPEVPDPLKAPDALKPAPDKNHAYKAYDPYKESTE